MMSPNTPTRRRLCGLVGLHQRGDDERHQRDVRDVVAHHDVPEATRRPLRHEHRGRADAEHGEHRPALRVDVEQRQVDQVAVVGAQVDVARADPARPHRVRVRVHDRLRLVGRARGEHDPERAQRFDRAARPTSRRRRAGRRTRGWLPAVGRVADDRDPTQVTARGADVADELGLGDRRDALRVIDEPPDLGRGGARVGGDGHRAQRRARQPREQHLGTVVGVDQDLVADLDPAVAQPGREAAGGRDELRVGPGLDRCRRRAPRSGPDGRASRRPSAAAARGCPARASAVLRSPNGPCPALFSPGRRREAIPRTDRGSCCRCSSVVRFG